MVPSTSLGQTELTKQTGVGFQSRLSGTDVLRTAYPWSLEQITSFSQTALQPCILMVEIRCVCVCNHFGRPLLGVSPAGSRRRWAWLSDQHSFVLDVWAAVYSLPLYLTQSHERSGQWPRQAIGTYKSCERQNSRREWQRQTLAKLNDGLLHKTQ